MQPRTRFWAALIAMFVLLASLTACGGSQQTDTTSPAASAEDDPSCFLPVTPEQMATLPLNKSYNLEGSLCVLDTASGTAQYHNEADGFKDYGFYAMLMRSFAPHENKSSLPVANLDPTLRMALEHVIGYDEDDGLPYRLYAETPDGEFIRLANDSDVIPGVVVTYVKYGNNEARPLAKALENPDPGYEDVFYVTSTDDESEEGSHGGSHRQGSSASKPSTSPSKASSPTGSSGSRAGGSSSGTSKTSSPAVTTTCKKDPKTGKKVCTTK